MNDALTRAQRTYEAKRKAYGERRITVRLDAEATRALAIFEQEHGSTKEATNAVFKWAAAFRALHVPPAATSTAAETLTAAR